jgi:hypothetical protein
LHIPDEQVMSRVMLQFPLPSQVGVLNVPSAHITIPQAVPGS